MSIPPIRPILRRDMYICCTVHSSGGGGFRFGYIYIVSYMQYVDVNKLAKLRRHVSQVHFAKIHLLLLCRYPEWTFHLSLFTFHFSLFTLGDQRLEIRKCDQPTDLQTDGHGLVLETLAWLKKHSNFKEYLLSSYILLWNKIQCFITVKVPFTSHGMLKTLLFCLKILNF